MKPARLLLASTFATTCAMTCATMGACAALPTGSSGNDADAFAHKMEAFVNKSAWDASTGAVRFKFREKREHIWDKQRGLLVYKTGDTEADLDLRDRGGFAFKNGVEVTGDDAKKLLDDAWSAYCNDTFWLNPIVKLFDPGTKRELVTIDGKRGLKVTYESGGVTPGDSYVWFADDDGKPTSVRMWVSVIPIKGIEFPWEGWQTLSTGAKVSLTHGAKGPSLSDATGAVDAKALGVDDMFAKLVARRGSPASAASPALPASPAHH